jgi:hypothetical protein
MKWSHHFYAAPPSAAVKYFDAAPTPTLAPNQLYNKPINLNQQKFKKKLLDLFSFDYFEFVVL